MLRIVIVILQNGKQIGVYPAEIEEGEGFARAIGTAIERATKENGVSIFDITIRIDKDQ